MFTINTENVTDSVCSLLNGKVTSNTVIDLLNDVLTDEAHLAMLLAQNNVIHEKGKLPGLIVNAYLLLVDLFDLDVMKPLEYEQPEDDVAAEEEVDNDDGIKIEVIDTIFPDNFFPKLDAKSNEAEPVAKEVVKAKRRRKRRISHDGETTTATTKDLEEGSGVLKCSFPGCVKTFQNVAYRRKHEKRVHAEKKFACAQCDSKFSTEYALKKHTEVTHGEKKQCPECDYVTADETLMRAHFRDKHTGIVIKCDICDKTYANMVTLKDHMKFAHLEKTIKCEHEGCERMFTTLVRMKTHFRKDHLIDYQTCDECGKVYQNKTKLVEHKRTCHQLPPNVKLEWACDQCSFVVCRTNQKGLTKGITMHKATHQPDRVKPWMCEFCSKRFTKKEDWLGHMNVHRGILPFTCIPCNKDYPSRPLLDQHFRRGAPHKGQTTGECWKSCAKITTIS